MSNRTKTLRLGITASIFAFYTFVASVSFAVDEGQDIQNRVGNPSPSAADSHVNDYTFQDEQVNIGPNDADVLVLRTDQKNLLNRFVTKAFPLHNVASREIRNVFRELTAKEGGRAEIIRDKVSKAEFLEVVCPQWQLPYIEKALPLLDEKWIKERNDGSQQVYYKAAHRDVASVDAIARNYAGEGFTAIDKTNNSAVRRDEPYRVEEWLVGAKLADVPEHQARFHVKIYEIDANKDTRIGLDYVSWKNGPGRNLFEAAWNGYDGREHIKNMSSFLTPFAPSALTKTDGTITKEIENHTNFSNVNYFLTAAYVDFLSVTGKAKTLVDGVIQTRSGSIGSFGSVDQVVAISARPDNPGTDGLTPTRISAVDASTSPTGDYLIHNRTLHFQNAGQIGVSVDITPVILMGSMEADVTVSVSDVSGFTPQGLPIINTSVSNTAVRMADGATLVLTGLTRDEKENSKQGMPVLSSLPVLGYLFGGENNINHKRQVVVVIEAQSDTGGESKLANPPEVKTIAAQVSDETKVEVPCNSFGFDQWLLGPYSGPKL